METQEIPKATRRNQSGIVHFQNLSEIENHLKYLLTCFRDSNLVRLSFKTYQDSLELWGVTKKELICKDNIRIKLTRYALLHIILEQYTDQGWRILGKVFETQPDGPDDWTSILGRVEVISHSIHNRVLLFHECRPVIDSIDLITLDISPYDNYYLQIKDYSCEKDEIYKLYLITGTMVNKNIGQVIGLNVLDLQISKYYPYPPMRTFHLLFSDIANDYTDYKVFRIISF